MIILFATWILPYLAEELKAHTGLGSYSKGLSQIRPWRRWEDDPGSQENKSRMKAAGERRPIVLQLLSCLWYSASYRQRTKDTQGSHIPDNAAERDLDTTENRLWLFLHLSSPSRNPSACLFHLGLFEGLSKVSSGWNFQWMNEHCQT